MEAFGIGNKCAWLQRIAPRYSGLIEMGMVKTLPTFWNHFCNYDLWASHNDNEELRESCSILFKVHGYDILDSFFQVERQRNGIKTDVRLESTSKTLFTKTNNAQDQKILADTDGYGDRSQRPEGRRQKGSLATNRVPWSPKTPHRRRNIPPP